MQPVTGRSAPVHSAFRLGSRQTPLPYELGRPDTRRRRLQRVETRADGSKVVYFAPEGQELSVTYFAEAPSGVGETGRDTFGPVEARAGEEWVTVQGTSDTNTVVGPQQP